MRARALDCTAPSFDLIIGKATGNPVRMILPVLAEGLLSLLPARFRAEADPAVDILADDGRRLSAYDAASGSFVVRLGSSTLSLGSYARLRAHPHDPDAPISYYNAVRARGVVKEMGELVQASIDDPRTSRVSRLRAEQLFERLQALAVELDQLCEALDRDPSLRELERAAMLARSVKRADDRASRDLDEILDRLRERAPVDVEILERDRMKWIAWHADSVGAYYAG